MVGGLICHKTIHTMQLANHHAHSHFSDGIKGPEVYLKRAIEEGLKVYGFSDHAPIPGTKFRGHERGSTSKI